MSLLEKYYKTVEDAIQRLGVDPKTCRTTEPNKWYLHRGKADVVVFVRESMMYNDTKKYAVVALSPIYLVKDELIQANRVGELLEFLMKINHNFIMERFSLESNIVFLSVTAFMDDMTDASMSLLLDSQSFYAQAFADRLEAEFGAATK